MHVKHKQFQLLSNKKVQMAIAELDESTKALHRARSAGSEIRPAELDRLLNFKRSED